MSDAVTTTLATIRRLLLALLASGLIGTLSELWLIGHHEDWRQLVPLVMIGTSAVALGWVAWSWTAGAVRVFRASMLFLMLSGATGSILEDEGTVREGNRQVRGRERSGASVALRGDSVAPC